MENFGMKRIKMNYPKNVKFIEKAIKKIFRKEEKNITKTIKKKYPKNIKNIIINYVLTQQMEQNVLIVL